MRLQIHRSDGRTGRYLQDNQRRAGALVLRLDPAKLFLSGPIVVGVHNPFTVLNPDEVCWIRIDEAGDMPGCEFRTSLPPGIDSVRWLPTRQDYENILARQWPKWRLNAGSNSAQLLEALVELTLKSSEQMYLHILGQSVDQPLADLVFSPPAITAEAGPDSMFYINPRAVVRARIYHSRDTVTYPNGILMVEAEDI